MEHSRAVILLWLEQAENIDTAGHGEHRERLDWEQVRQTRAVLEAHAETRFGTNLPPAKRPLQLPSSRTLTSRRHLQLLKQSNPASITLSLPSTLPSLLSILRCPAFARRTSLIFSHLRSPPAADPASQLLQCPPYQPHSSLPTTFFYPRGPSTTFVRTSLSGQPCPTASIPFR